MDTYLLENNCLESLFTPIVDIERLDVYQNPTESNNEDDGVNFRKVILSKSNVITSESRPKKCKFELHFCPDPIEDITNLDQFNWSLSNRMHSEDIMVNLTNGELFVKSHHLRSLVDKTKRSTQSKLVSGFNLVRVLL